MFGFLKRRKAAIPVDYDSEWLGLQNRYADPAIELATTKKAVVVSAASVLDRLWNGNGGLGWDESCEEDYIAPLREHLVTRDVFSESECEHITDKLDAIVAIGRENAKRTAAVGEGETTLLPAGEEVRYIVEQTVKWCRHSSEPIPLRGDDEYRGHF
ncbi:hypothetical protein [Opitutus sp. ER46]|uniref:hypothetical protein n=1 Tax=Opitutus sp. ER46 TaxID=2161864 RepID=UPI000D306104|nr:hypothetical protein [Opitutus sp. ER46]PTY00140.1 hypothetical protein DB354_02300 [Opitutus sp. ER46]